MEVVVWVVVDIVAGDKICRVFEGIDRVQGCDGVSVVMDKWDVQD